MSGELNVIRLLPSEYKERRRRWGVPTRIVILAAGIQNGKAGGGGGNEDRKGMRGGEEVI